MVLLAEVTRRDEDASRFSGSTTKPGRSFWPRAQITAVFLLPTGMLFFDERNSAKMREEIVHE
jgi:hypothetical protein